jgi:hypothetical protein
MDNKNQNSENQNTSQSLAHIPDQITLPLSDTLTQPSDEPHKYRFNYTIDNNTVYAGRYSMDLTGVDNLTVNGNTIYFDPYLGCAAADGIALNDSHTVLIENNNFTIMLSGYTFISVANVNDLSTNVILTNNTLN